MTKKITGPGVANAGAPKISSAGSGRDLRRAAGESKDRPGLQAGDRFFLHVVDDNIGSEYYFPNKPDDLPGRWIAIVRVGDGWMDEVAHSFWFFKFERLELKDLLAEFADDDLLIAVPYGAAWVEVGETMGGRTGNGYGKLWVRRRRMARNPGGAS